MCLSTSQIVSNLLAEKRAFVNFLYDRMIESTKPYCSRIAKEMADCQQIPYEIFDFKMELGNLYRFCIQAANSVAKCYFLLNFLHLFVNSIAHYIANLFVLFENIPFQLSRIHNLLHLLRLHFFLWRWPQKHSPYMLGKIFWNLGTFSEFATRQLILSKNSFFCSIFCICLQKSIGH